MRRLPAWLRKFFWDVDFETLDLARYRAFVLRRLLARGDWRAWKWVRRHFSESELRDFIVRTRGRGIDEPQRLTFYAAILGIPYATVIGWLRERADPWSRRHAAVSRKRPSLATRRGRGTSAGPR